MYSRIMTVGAALCLAVAGCESNHQHSTATTDSSTTSAAAMRSYDEDAAAKKKVAAEKKQAAKELKHERAMLVADAEKALEKLKKADPSMVNVLRDAKGYAVFPTVGKGAVGVGGAYGKGVLYERGYLSGYCELTQASVGVALGGQSYSEVIVFSTVDAINHLKVGSTALDAQATAVAAKSGAGANAKYRDGVAIFTFDEAGLMFEASVGGQKFSYEPK